MTDRSVRTRPIALAVVLATALLASGGPGYALCPIPTDEFTPDPEFTSSFMLEQCKFKTTGANPYFILKPGYQLFLEGEEDGELIQAQITVLRETEVVDGVKTRVVEEREWVDGVLVEVSRNFFAICKQTNSVVYFGEDVEIFNPDGTTSNDGAWRAGVNGAKAGFIMPGTILLGGRYYQEIAPEDGALDKGEIVGMDEHCAQEALVDLAEDFDLEHCVEIVDTTDCDPEAEDTKFYAAGIGIVVDGDLELVEFGFVGRHGDRHGEDDGDED